MTPSSKWISSLALAAAMSLVSLSSSAGELGFTKTVKAWDLDLAKPADVQALQQRLHDAAADVCRAETQRLWQSTRQRAPVGWHQQCVRETVAAAVRDVGSALAAR